MRWGLRRGLLLLLALFTAAALVAGFPGIKCGIAETVEGIEKIRLERLTSNHKVKVTPNFKIKYTLQDANVVDRVAGHAEAQYDAITSYLGYHPAGRITIIIYPNAEELERGLRLPSGDSTLGAFYADTINILSPNKWGPSGDQAEKGLYLHELTHLLMDQMAGGNYPVWFTEGMALYHEYIFTGYEWGKDHLFQNNPYSIEELTLYFGDLDQVLAYKQSFLLVKHIMERKGKEEMLELFRRLKEGDAFDKAFRETMGFSLEEAEKGL